MVKSVTAAIVAAAMSFMFVINASASPLTSAKSQSGLETGATLVRDGCGPGRFFSERAGRCIEERGPARDFQRGPRGDDRVFFGPGGGRIDPRARKEICQQRCLQKREVCNEVKGGFLNGCGVQAAACIAQCD
jgi:hypothetical protein